MIDPEPEPDSIIIIQLLILIILIMLSAFFSASETAFTSLSKSRLKTRIQDDKRSASQKKKSERALKMYGDYDRLLFTLLIGNNIVNITASTIATLLFINLLNNNQLAPTISTIVLTAVVLVFGEIMPKTMAKEYPEAFAENFSGLIKVFVYLLWPICIIFTGLKKLFVKMFKLKKSEGVTEEEILNIVEEASEEGSLNKSESELISNAIEFHDCEVAEILVPRVNVVAISQDTPLNKIKEVFFKNGYSRLPVYNESLDNVVGMIHEKDFLNLLDRGYKSINGIIKKVAYATEHMKISALLKVFQKSKVHMAVVIDEYGGTVGIVTLEDVLEELVGEIWDEHDEVVEYFEKINQNTYKVDANADLGDFFETFKLDCADDDFDSQTVGGWITEKLGDMPKKNDFLDFEHLHIVVTRCNQKRIFELRVTILDTQMASVVESDIDSQDVELAEAL